MRNILKPDAPRTIRLDGSFRAGFGFTAGSIVAVWTLRAVALVLSFAAMWHGGLIGVAGFGVVLYSFGLQTGLAVTVGLGVLLGYLTR